MISRKSPISPLRVTPTGAKLAVKPKLRKCAICKLPYERRTMAHTVCSPVCAIVKAQADRERKERAAIKLERKDDAARRQQAKTLTDWIADAQKVFNAWVRLRDADLPCICCGKFGGAWSRGGIWDAGHYRSRGSAGHLRFDQRNCHKQLKQCNSFGAGRHADFRVGLIGRIGLEAVEALEADQAVHKWTIAECQEIIATYRGKIKALKATQ